MDIDVFYFSGTGNSLAAARIETKAKVIEYMVDCLNLRETAQKSSWLKIGGFQGRTELPFIESVKLMDHAFWSDDSCISCGICSKICPSANIKLVNGSPKWRHNCCQCFACLNWCPKNAIQFSTKTPGQKRYHHPNINLSDIIPDKTM